MEEQAKEPVKSVTDKAIEAHQPVSDFLIEGSVKYQLEFKNGQLHTKYAPSLENEIAAMTISRYVMTQIRDDLQLAKQEGRVSKKDKEQFDQALTHFTKAVFYTEKAIERQINGFIAYKDKEAMLREVAEKQLEEKKNIEDAAKTILSVVKDEDKQEEKPE